MRMTDVLSLAEKAGFDTPRNNRTGNHIISTKGNFDITNEVEALCNILELRSNTNLYSKQGDIYNIAADYVGRLTKVEGDPAHNIYKLLKARQKDYYAKAEESARKLDKM